MGIEIEHGFLKLHDITTDGPRWVKGSTIMALIPVPAGKEYKGTQVTIGPDSLCIQVG